MSDARNSLRDIGSGTQVDDGLGRRKKSEVAHEDEPFLPGGDETLEPSAAWVDRRRVMPVGEAEEQVARRQGGLDVAAVFVVTVSTKQINHGEAVISLVYDVLGDS